MNRILHAFCPHGRIRIQPSKSVLHRALICAALAEGESKIRNFAVSEDIEATMRVLEGLGLAAFHTEDSICTVKGGLHESPKRELGCGESGTTLRLLFPLALDGHQHILRGEGRLMQRPFEPYQKLCAQQRIELLRADDAIGVCGTLHSANVHMRGDVSSQFVSGLLLAFARVSGESRVVLTTPLESAPYVDITREVMADFGVVTRHEGDVFSVEGIQRFTPADFTAEGDYSHAAFFAAAAAVAGHLRLEGLSENSAQGDRRILRILEDAGAGVAWDKDGVEVSCGRLRPFEVDVSQIPDLVPVLAAVACAADGTSVLRNAARLRLKESDRLSAMHDELEKLGAGILEKDDALIIRGTGRLSGGAVSSHNDHRVVMALAVASLIADGPVLIEGTQAVRKSAPGFFEQWQQIGGGN